MTSPEELADVRERVRARYVGTAAAGITITSTHQLADGLYSAIVRAARP